MKASITEGGFIKIEAETIEEVFAIKYLFPAIDHGGKICDVCGQFLDMKKVVICTSLPVNNEAAK